MPPRSSTSASKKKARRKSTPSSSSSSSRNNEERAVSKSPAEFFAENQSIAGFDNPGKSLYTTVRELVENSLDACESARTLPDVSVLIEEMSQDQFNALRGTVQRRQGAAGGGKSNKKKGGAGVEDFRFVFTGTDVFERTTASDDGKSESESGGDDDDDEDRGRKRKGGGKRGKDDSEESEEDYDPSGEDTGKKKVTKKGSGAKKEEKPPPTSGKKDTKKGKTPNSNKKKTSSTSTAEARYFRVAVRDNGCGMRHEAVPQLFGRVLSSSKYGVRQTRGKFGLGAKMALIWSKKSTGVPIQVRTMMKPPPPSSSSSKAAGGKGAEDEEDEWDSDMEDDEDDEDDYDDEDEEVEDDADVDAKGGGRLTTCVLDIDIYKNRPRVLLHTLTSGASFGVGTEIVVVIGGNWTTYKSRIVQYLHQLAIITPYARLSLKYVDLSSTSSSKKDITIKYDRRSDQMPDPAQEVKHHPSSVNNLLVQRLLDHTKTKTLEKFLCKELSGVTPTLAKKVLETSGSLKAVKLDASTRPSAVNDAQVTRLVQVLRSSTVFRTPDASCLSPLGEYNLNLGVRKVVEPDIVATARDKPGAVEGHPFLVEAAVSLGGKDAKEGITVVRFANRIPLLFEAGADVVTRVTQNKIKWSAYKIDHKRDKIGVFVSIVSTKIPFKGTGKEYIGDDITEIQLSVKRALQTCCQQLRTHLTKRNALRDIKERQSRLVKYVPDVSRAVFGLLSAMQKRKLDEVAGESDEDSAEAEGRGKKAKSCDGQDGLGADEMLKKLQQEDISEDAIKESLMESITAQQSSINAKAALSPRRRRLLGLKAQPLFLVPIGDDDLVDGAGIIEHPAFVFRPLRRVVSLPLIFTDDVNML